MLSRVIISSNFTPRYISRTSVCVSVFSIKYANVYCCVIYNSQKVETTQMSINRQMNKQNMTYPYNGITFGQKRNDVLAKCYNLDEP